MRKKKSSSKKRLIIILLIFIVVCIAVLFKGFQYFLQQEEKKQARLSRYDVFGIEIPQGYLIHGIDISSHQSFVFWPSVKRMKVEDVQVGFVYIKATEGIKDEDKLFKRNWEGAKQARIPRGAYHFFISTKSGLIQARNFIKTVSLQKGDLPPVVDVEQLYGVTPALMRRRMKECLQKLEQWYQIKPLIYTNIDFYQNFLGKEFDDYPLWIANYLEPEKPQIKRDWLFWQHNDKGRIDGIRTRVDFNVFNGDSLAFKRLLLN